MCFCIFCVPHCWAIIIKLPRTSPAKLHCSSCGAIADALELVGGFAVALDHLQRLVAPALWRRSSITRGYRLRRSSVH
jgi:hypothetical protein